MVGIEPTSLAAHDFESCMFTNFITSACLEQKKVYRPLFGLSISCILKESLFLYASNHCDCQPKRGGGKSPYGHEFGSGSCRDGQVCIDNRNGSMHRETDSLSVYRKLTNQTMDGIL